MRLLIDAGNTRIKWAIAESFADEIVASGVVSENWGEVSVFATQVDSVWVSCVAGRSVVNEIFTEVRSAFEVDAQLVSVSASAGGLTNNYADLDRLGVDRWVAAIGARAVAKHGALIVIDAGTAITIDLVTEDNCFEGGVILPGFASMHDALLERTAGIDSYRQPVDSVVGKNTRECVNSGVQYGMVGAIERIVAEMRAILGDAPPRVMVMGGDASAITAYSNLKVELQSNMIFNGLMLLSKK
jgi:type III pantothenate kinase